MIGNISEAKFCIFDFDGTLTNSIHKWEEIDLKVYQEFNLQYDSLKHFEVTMGFSMFEICQWIISYNNLENVTPQDIMQVYRDCGEKVFRDEVKFINGAEKFINILIEKNIPFGIATASPLYIIHAFLENHPKIKESVKAVVSCDDVGTSKPDPAVFLECMKRIGADVKHTAIFEDSLHGLQGAKATGAFVVGLLADKRLFEEKKALCDVFSDDYEAFM